MLRSSHLKEALCLAQGMACHNYLDLVREQNNGKRKKEKRANYTTTACRALVSQTCAASAANRVWPTTSVSPFPHELCSIASASHQMQPNQSSTNANGMESSRTRGLPVGSFGIFLPVCLLAIFLSCVVCAYSWQSARERRLDFEDNRKRKRTISKYDSSCTLKTYKSMPKSKVRAYPWKASARIKDLPDINKNVAFVIPTFSELKHGSRSCYGDSLWSSGCVGQPCGLPKKPILKRPNVRNSSTWTTNELLGLSFSTETEINLSIPSSWSADTSAEGCHVGYNTENKDSGLPVEMDVINNKQCHVIEPLHGEIVCVQTLNGSLYEYWV